VPAAHVVATAAQNVGLGDQFISIAQFRPGGGRGNDRIMSFGGVAIDIDRSGVDVETLVQEVLATCLRLSGIPLPTAIVATGGRGIHCYWMFSKRLPGRAGPRWRKLVSWLVTRFHADPACVDPARLFRLPGSIHRKTNQLCSIVYWTGETVDFERLFERAVPLARAEIRAKRKARLARQAKRGARKPGRRANFHADLVRLAIHEGSFREGWRNIAVHIAASVLSQHLAGSELAAAVSRFGKTCTVPTLPEREVQAAIAMAEAKRQEDGGGYRYSRAGIMRKLGITPERARAAGLVHLVPDAVPAVERKRRQRLAAGRSPQAQSRERAAPWRKAGMSRSRWYDRRKRLATARRLREISQHRAAERFEKAAEAGSGLVWRTTMGVALCTARTEPLQWRRRGPGRAPDPPPPEHAPDPVRRPAEASP
jgi:hypothetical protein